MSQDDFYHLPVDDQVSALEKLARAALANWAIEEPELWLLKYRENCVFGVRDPSSGRKYALRIHRHGYHSEAALRSELAWMEALRTDGIETPEVIHTATGELLALVQAPEVPEPRFCDLLGWVDGEVLGNIEGNATVGDVETRANYFRAGQVVARIHDQGGCWTRPEGFVRPVMDGPGLVGTGGYLGDFRLHPDLTGEQLALLDRAAGKVLADLESFGTAPDRFGLSHADFLPENLLVDGDVVRIIDFDDCGFGWHMMDLATPLFFLLGEPQYDAAQAGLIEGYRSVRELPDAHLELLPVFLLARCLTYVAWVASRHETETARELSPMLIGAAVELAQEYLG